MVDQVDPAQGSLGFAHFLAQTDAVGKAILVIMLLMSIVSWYLIVTKALARWLERRAPFERLEQSAAAARARGEEAVRRALEVALLEETVRHESGLTALASVGSTAPFIGLFGTVWGVYHALVAIGLSGQGTLDRVAGPVGEALIMTALGLAVAIPAVLAYNAFVRSNRLVLAKLDAFAHDLHAVITTGVNLKAA
jgi:biopolymer transport protein ExbB